MSKVVKKSNLCVVVRKYQGQDGQEKSIWKTIGELTTFQKDDGGYNTIAELYTMPGVTISVFEQTQNKQTAQNTAPQQQQQAPQTQSSAAQGMTQGMQRTQEQNLDEQIASIPF